MTLWLAAYALAGIALLTWHVRAGGFAAPVCGWWADFWAIIGLLLFWPLVAVTELGYWIKDKCRDC